MQPELTRSISETLRPPSAILPALRSDSALGIVILGEVSTKFNQYHIVSIHNSTVEDGKQNHTARLTIPRNQDNNETDLEVAQIVAGTASMSPSSRPEEASPDNFFDASDKPMDMENYTPNESTMPAANMFVTIRGGDEWLKRYLPDGHNSQIGNVPNRVEITTEDGEEWYRIRIPYLERFYNTEVHLVGKQDDTIYALRGGENEMVCIRILWAPYDLVLLEECLRNNQYLRLKGISSFEEKEENILNRLVSIEERTLLKEIDSKTCLNDEMRQKLHERRLKALPIMLRELSQLEDKNPDQIELYIKQKNEFTVGTRMLIDQIDNILRRDDQLRQTMGFQEVKSGADPGFDQGGAPDRDRPKTAILGPQFCRILVLGPHFWWSGGGPGPPGPPLDPPLKVTKILPIQ